jgi:hypothetical protein
MKANQKDTTYNGWSNRATWNVSLWLNNDEGLYRALRDVLRHAHTIAAAADAIEQLCEDLWPDGKTPDGDNWREADFREIGKAELED